MSVQSLLNGVACESSLSNDRALHFGDGLFETIAVINGDPCLWDRHFLRLEKGCKRLGIVVPERLLLFKEALLLCDGITRGVLKVMVSAGEVSRGYWRSKEQSPTRLLNVKAWPQGSAYSDNTPVSLGLCKTRLGTQPLLAGIKHLNRLEQVMARAELNEDTFEGIMLNQDGMVVEGIMSNILIDTGLSYITPSIINCGVEGVMRELMLDVATKNRVSVNVQKVTLAQLRAAKNLYIMNSLLGVKPVSNFQEKAYSHSEEMPAWLKQVNLLAFEPASGAS